MRTYLAITCICFFAGRCTSAPVSEKLIAAIHHVETGGRMGPIKGDGGAALGPLQIHRAYWIDSGVAGRYQQCADLAYAKQVIRAYMARYCPHGSNEKIARIHNGGPRGHLRKSTLIYWQKVQAEMDRATVTIKPNGK